MTKWQTDVLPEANRPSYSKPLLFTRNILPEWTKTEEAWSFDKTKQFRERLVKVLSNQFHWTDPPWISQYGSFNSLSLCRPFTQPLRNCWVNGLTSGETVTNYMRMRK